MTRQGEGVRTGTGTQPSFCVSPTFLPAGCSQLWNAWVREAG